MAAADAETHSNTAVFIDEEVKTFAMKSRNIAKGLTVSVEQRQKIHYTADAINVSTGAFRIFRLHINAKQLPLLFICE